ncbi:MAG TPA: PTS sugar transporter subunit IIA, partial [Methanoregula sp.]|nr:PTS sugar transporter subunit IIA [Methanoregula sp.]
SSRGPNSEMLLRYASRLAGKLNRSWYAVYVQTQKEAATVVDATTQRLISNTLTMAKQLGGTVFTYKGEDVVDTILRFAREYRVGHIVIGAPAGRPFWKRLLGIKSIVERLIVRSKGIVVVVVDTASRATVHAPVEVFGETAPAEPERPRVMSLGRLLSRNIMFWEEPVDRDEVIRAIVHAACREATGCNEREALQAVMARESEGSTFLNEGLAIPHARLKGIKTPGAALGITRAGITGEATGAPVRHVLLSLTPDEEPEVQMQIFGVACHAFQDRFFLQAMDRAVTAEDVRDAIASWSALHRRAHTEGAETGPANNTDERYIREQ